MFTLTPLAAALQGIGYGSLLTALQGLWSATVVPEPVTIESLGSMAATLPVRTSTRRRTHRGTRWVAPSWAPLPNDPTAPAAERHADDEEALTLAFAF